KAKYADFRIPLSVQYGYYGTRSIGRHLRLAVALGDIAFANQIWDQISHPSSAWLSTYGTWIAANPCCDPGNHASDISAVIFGTMSAGMIDYYQALPAGSRKSDVGNHIVAAANFAKEFWAYPGAGPGNGWADPHIWLGADVGG